MRKTFSIVSASAPAPPPAPTPTASATVSSAPPSAPAAPLARSTDPLDLLPRAMPGARVAPAADSTVYAASSQVSDAAEPSPGSAGMNVAATARTTSVADVEMRPLDPGMSSLERPRKRPRSTTGPCESTPTAPAAPATPASALPSLAKARLSATSASILTAKRPREVPLPVQPLIQVSPRVYFAMFDGFLPSPALLNAHGGTHSAIFPRTAPKSAGMNAPPPQRLPFTPARNKAKTPEFAWAPNTIECKFTWFTIDRTAKGKHEYNTVPNQFAHLPFFDDWGPLNMSLVYQFCDLLNEYLTVCSRSLQLSNPANTTVKRPSLRDHGIVLYTSTRPRVKANAVAMLALRMVLIENKTPCEALHPFTTVRSVSKHFG